MDERIRKLLDDTSTSRAEITAPAIEVLEQLHRALLAIPPFTLSDGTKVRLDPYISPGIDNDGHASCSVDVLLENKGHLEFTMTNTGWGKLLGPQADRRESDTLGDETRSR